MRTWAASGILQCVLVVRSDVVQYGGTIDAGGTFFFSGRRPIVAPGSLFITDERVKNTTRIDGCQLCFPGVQVQTEWSTAQLNLHFLLLCSIVHLTRGPSDLDAAASALAMQTLRKKSYTWIADYTQFHVRSAAVHNPPITLVNILYDEYTLRRFPCHRVHRSPWNSYLRATPVADRGSRRVHVVELEMCGWSPHVQAARISPYLVSISRE